MKIQGVDALILNKVQEQTQKPAVQELKKSKVENRYDNQDERNNQQAGNGHQLDDSVKQLNKAAEALNVELKFEVHKDTHRVVVKVIDKAKNEVIREIPPEKIVDMVSQMQHMIGLFVDQRV